MVALIAVVLALGVLWAWLAGHWFARVLVGIVLMPLVPLALAAAIWGILQQAHATEHVMQGAAIAAGILGVPLAWWIVKAPRRRAAPGVDYLVPPSREGWASSGTWQDRAGDSPASGASPGVRRLG